MQYCLEPSWGCQKFKSCARTLACANEMQGPLATFLTAERDAVDALLYNIGSTRPSAYQFYIK